MLEWEAERIAWFVRLAARISAFVFTAVLVLAGRARAAAATGGTPHRRRMRTVLVLFLVTHTAHFCLILALARATDGANIEARGGWLLTTAQAVLFYTSIAWIWWRETACLRSSRLPGSWLPLLILWGAFVHAYVPRVARDPAFTPVLGELAVALAVYLWGIRSQRRRSRRTAGPA